MWLVVARKFFSFERAELELMKYEFYYSCTADWPCDYFD